MEFEIVFPDGSTEQIALLPHAAKVTLAVLQATIFTRASITRLHHSIIAG